MVAKIRSKNKLTYFSYLDFPEKSFVTAHCFLYDVVFIKLKNINLGL